MGEKLVFAASTPPDGGSGCRFWRCGGYMHPLAIVVSLAQ